MVGSVHELPAARQPDDGGVWERARRGRAGTSAAAHADEICAPVVGPHPALHQHKGPQAVPLHGAHCRRWWGAGSCCVYNLAKSVLTIYILS